MGDVLVSGDTLYGTTAYGGAGPAFGTVYSVPTGGGNVNTLCTFGGVVGAGVMPETGLALSGNTLYGVLSATLTSTGVANGNAGAVFSIPVTGGTPSMLIGFGTKYGGTTPLSQLIIANQSLYGTASFGSSGTTSSSNGGILFSISTSNSQLTEMAKFQGPNGNFPRGKLLLSDGILYGTTASGGTYDHGTVYSIPLAGGPLTTLASFTGTNGDLPFNNLIRSGNTLYGTTEFGGVYGDGTVFSVPLTGGTPTVLTNFDGNNGGNPRGGLLAVGNTLYGTTYGEVDPNDFGTVFSLPMIGGLPTTLVTFTGPNGANPTGGLVADGAGNLYGTTAFDLNSGWGTLFKLSPVSVPEPGSLSLLPFVCVVLLTRFKARPRSSCSQ